MFSSSVYSNSSTSSSLVIVGGRTIDSILSDVWILNGRAVVQNSNEESTETKLEPEVIFEWQQLLQYELPHPRCAHTSWILSSGQSSEIGNNDNNNNDNNFEMIIFGGFTGQGISDDIIRCVLNSNFTISSSSPSWIPLETSQTIPGRFGHVMCQSPSWMIPKKQQKSVFPHLTVLLYGGIDAEQDYNDLWMISLPNTSNRII